MLQDGTRQLKYETVWMKFTNLYFNFKFKKREE